MYVFCGKYGGVVMATAFYSSVREARAFIAAEDGLFVMWLFMGEVGVGKKGKKVLFDGCVVFVVNVYVSVVMLI